MKRVVLAIICLILLILDNSIVPFFSIFNGAPSLLLCFVICFSIINGRWEATIIGAFSGLLQDIFFYKYYGINALANLLLCILAAVIGENIFKNRKFIPVLSTFCLSIIKLLFVMIVLYLAKVKMSLGYSMLISAVYNMVIVFLIYNRVYRFSNKKYMKVQWKFNKD
ncbi:rod shape-determining protein MreD [Clostridium zeae]|uniref:rod shape-determining protein MreD n=1 Tax=Clostridium zeae TaxID=2759022 RepID=UPI001A8E2477|nr:rod shape-determining protein MreD [Clostridium zeae]